MCTILGLLQSEEFRDSVQKYIESTEVGNGGDYWPIVKQMVMHIPNCEICSTGAVLVDLPGVRDANAARDKVAKEVWTQDM